MLLEVYPDLRLPQGTEHLLGRLNLEIGQDDGMYRGNPRHYLSCGASALSVILAALRLADLSDPVRLLDFGAGAGRVTRWLRAAFPLAAIDACDLRAQDLVFCERHFQARTWITGVDIDSLRAPASYDLIWLGSVITHLPASAMLHLLEKLLSWMNPAALLVMSFHGRYALTRQDQGEFQYIHAEGWKTIKAGYADLGYGYSDYEGQQGYGISVTKLSWIAALLEGRVNARLVLLTEKAWDEHHDVFAIQKL